MSAAGVFLPTPLGPKRKKLRDFDNLVSLGIVFLNYTFFLTQSLRLVVARERTAFEYPNPHENRVGRRSPRH